jgi:hypothetical protein
MFSKHPLPESTSEAVGDYPWTGIIRCLVRKSLHRENQMVDLLLHVDNVGGITDVMLMEQACVVLFTLVRIPPAPLRLNCRLEQPSEG